MSEEQAVKRIALTIAIGSIRQSVYYVVVDACPVEGADKKLVIEELHALAKEFETRKQEIIKQQVDEIIAMGNAQVLLCTVLALIIEKRRKSSEEPQG